MRLVFINPNVGRPFGRRRLWLHPIGNAIQLFAVRPFGLDAVGNAPGEGVDPGKYPAIDFRVSERQPIYAPVAGRVILRSGGSAGNDVCIRQTLTAAGGEPLQAFHNVYHLKTVAVANGAQVAAGDVIGHGGGSGFVLNAQGQQRVLEAPVISWAVRLVVPERDPNRFVAIVSRYNRHVHRDEAGPLRVMAWWLSTGEHEGAEVYLRSLELKGQSAYDARDDWMKRFRDTLERWTEGGSPEETAEQWWWWAGAAVVGVGALAVWKIAR